MSVKKIILNLAIIAAEVSAIRFGYGVYSDRIDFSKGAILMLASCIALLLLVIKSRSRGYRWVRPGLWKTTLLIGAVLVVGSFAGCNPITGYWSVQSASSPVGAGLSTATSLGGRVASIPREGSIKEDDDASAVSFWGKVTTFFSRAKSVLLSALIKVSITDVIGESTFVIQIEPNKDDLDFEAIYCVVLTAKDGYIFSHEQVFWIASEFRSARGDRTVQSNLNGLRVVYLSAPAMDKTIFPMRQEISQLAAKKKEKAESDFLEFFWDGKSLAPYGEDELQSRYIVSSSERALIARRYVDVKVMLYADYLALKEARGQ